MVSICCAAIVVVIIIIILVVALRRDRVREVVYPRRGPIYPPPQQFPAGSQQTLHCPTCGAPAVWDSAHGRYECPDCGRYI